ncbi:MAG TPA: GDP-mannose 4,6-dehydratase [Candidatus Hydrogenedentes bacterium]|nr:GDP-mannose 4,6-dehydratase [Candidatus Hydrogenedentota bacterium]HPG65517.1 GDP-mannose 4,6-dehydratase [Candidatus Hydrogenedentota bacterium]
MKRVLITGAAGFIGSHLADRLLERGDNVVGLDDFNDYYDPDVKRRNVEQALGHPEYALFEDDICNSGRLFELFEQAQPEVVVHLAARAGVRPSISDPNLYYRVNVIGSQNILDACRHHSISHLVFASSSSVYGGCTEVPFAEDNPVHRPVSPYAATKRMNELQAHVASHLYGLNVTMLRFFTVYGPRQRPDMAIHKFTRMIDNDEPVPMFGDGSTQRDYTYIDDIMDGVIKAVDTPFRYEIFNLGEHHTTRLIELIELIARSLGKPAHIEQWPEQPGDVTITYADIGHARAALGYNPTVPMEEGVQRFVAWYREQKG